MRPLDKRDFALAIKGWCDAGRSACSGMVVASIAWTKSSRAEGDGMKLPNDPQERNDERALWAQIALAAFVAETGTDESNALVEFLVGVMHWCDRSGESFEAHLQRARSLYGEEKNATAVRRAEDAS
jgi:hypothetical protein